MSLSVSVFFHVDLGLHLRTGYADWQKLTHPETFSRAATAPMMSFEAHWKVHHPARLSATPPPLPVPLSNHGATFPLPPLPLPPDI